MALERPVYTTETADGATAPVVAAPESTTRGGPAQTPPLLDLVGIS